MLTESVIVGFYDLYPLSFPKLGRAKKSFKILRVVFYVLAFGLTIQLVDKDDVVNIVTILRNAVITCCVVGSIGGIYFAIFPLEAVYFEDLAEFEVNTDENLDVFFLPMIILIINTIIGISFLYYTVTLYDIMVTSQNFALFQLMFLKSGISRRMRFLLKSALSSQNILETLPRVSKLLELNQRFNQLHSFQGLISVASGLHALWWSLTAYWRFYGLHQSTGSVEELLSPWLNMFYHCQVVFVLTLFGFSASWLSNEIENWVWEIDRKASKGNSPLQYRRKLETFILELEITPTEFTAFGLFSVDNSTITSALGFTINTMMIVVQFLK